MIEQMFRIEIKNAEKRRSRFFPNWCYRRKLKKKICFFCKFFQNKLVKTKENLIVRVEKFYG